MSSTETLRRTEPFSRIFTEHGAALRTFAAAALLTILLVSFRPFQPSGGLKAGEGGDILNQLGFGGVGAVSFILLISFVDRRALRALLSPVWLVMLAFILFSVRNALDPAGAFRAVAFMMMAVLGVLAALTLNSNADGFSRTLLTAGTIILVLSFAGIVLLPDVAKHNIFSGEPEHAGLWRGIYSHKNVAGPIMAGLMFSGLYLFRRGLRWQGGAMAVAALIFLSNTGSKTSALLAPMVFMLVAGPGFLGMRRIAPIAVFTAICVFALATVGTVLFEPLHDLRETLSPGTTFTGRTDLWKFAFENIAKRPWTGFGFESFWFTPDVYYGEPNRELAWDVRGAVHGHNGYVDIALTMGIPALIAAVFALILAPLSDYARVRKTRENVLMADLFLMIFTFSALNAFLESFFFRRADPVWLMFLLAVFGLRMVSRFEVGK